MNVKSDPKEKLPLGIIGLGRMGKCIISGLLEAGLFNRSDISFTTKHKDTSENSVQNYGVHACSSNAELVKKCNIIILAVKPQNLAEVLKDISPHLKKNHTLFSIMASISTSQIESIVGKIAVIRAMPNTPAFVRESMTPMCLGKFATEKDWGLAEKLFGTLGKVVRVDEKHMDAITGLSGCGPAYVYVVLESLTDAGIKVGLSRELSTLLASQTVLGAAKMLQVTGKHPAALKDEVTTPAGCTIDGLLELEEGRLRVTLIKAVVQATKRAETLKNQK